MSCSGSACVANSLAIVRKYTRTVHRFHHSARGNGGAGELVEFAAVAFLPSMLVPRIAKRLSAESQIQSERSARWHRPARGFPGVKHAHAGQRAVQSDADQQMDRAAVPIRRNRRQMRPPASPSDARDKPDRFVAAEQLSGGHIENVAVETLS